MVLYINVIDMFGRYFHGGIIYYNPNSEYYVVTEIMYYIYSHFSLFFGSLFSAILNIHLLVEDVI